MYVPATESVSLVSLFVLCHCDKIVFEELGMWKLFQQYSITYSNYAAWSLLTEGYDALSALLFCWHDVEESKWVLLSKILLLIFMF